MKASMKCPACGQSPCFYKKSKPVTTNGAACSPKLAERYAWLHDEGVALWDWSTDDCVARDYERIRVAADKAESAGKLDLAESVRRLLGRVPAERVSRLVSAKAAEPAKDAAQTAVNSAADAAISGNPFNFDLDT